MSYKNKGKIGDITPKNLSHAVEICQAAAKKTARKSKSVVSEALHGAKK